MEEADQGQAIGRDRWPDARSGAAMPEGRRRFGGGGRRPRQQCRSGGAGEGVDHRNQICGEGGRMTDRYARQTVLAEVGAAGQARLAAASVLVVGAGGLGCPVLQYLAGAGVGRLTIVDHDTVEESNLHRQPIYGMDDIGKAKAEAARDRLQRFNPDIAIEAVVARLTPQNAAGLVAKADVIVDAADSFAVTYILSDACHAAAKPLVSASVIGLTGYAGAFCGGGPSYRAVFPDVSIDGGTCASVGVLGTAVA